MMKKIGGEVLAKLKSIGNVEFLDDRSVNPVSIPFWELSFLPIGILLYRFRHFLFLSFAYGLLITVLAFATQLSYVCGLSEWNENPYFGCTSSPAVYVTFFLLRLLIVAVFLKTWYKTAVCGEALNVREMFIISARDWKLFGGILIIVGCFCLPLVSTYILAVRVPNPDWRIESLFFAVASSGFWLPFLALRFLSVFAFALGGQKRPPLKLFWQRTTGNTLKIIMALTLIIVLNTIIFLNYNLLAAFVIGRVFTVGAVVCDLVYNMLFLLMSASFASMAVVQREALFSWYAGERQNEGEAKDE